MVFAIGFSQCLQTSVYPEHRPYGQQMMGEVCQCFPVMIIMHTSQALHVFPRLFCQQRQHIPAVLLIGKERSEVYGFHVALYWFSLSTQGMVHGGVQLVARERFVKASGKASLHQFLFFPGYMGGHCQYRNLLRVTDVGAAQQVEQLIAVHARHLDVGEQQIVLPFAQSFHQFLHILAGVALQSHTLQLPLGQFQHHGIIIHGYQPYIFGKTEWLLVAVIVGLRGQGEGKGNTEGSPLADLTFQRDVALQQYHQLAGNAQSKPEAVLNICVGQSAERLIDGILLFLADTCSRVAHFQQHVPFCISDQKRDTAFLRKLDGVAHQVLADLQYPFLVTRNEYVLSLEIGLQVYSLFLRCQQEHAFQLVGNTLGQEHCLIDSVLS